MITTLLAVAAIAVAQDTTRGTYWQQDVAYDITARLDEPSGVLAGTQTIRYTNRSPDTLRTFALHLYLNAFRPGSRWADRDSVEGNRRFNDLADPDFAFNHVRNVRIMGRRVTAEYPFAPDSTIVRFTLPEPLPPGGSLTAEMEWDARPSTLPRRQGRRGRRFDFAQWYPKVVVYDTYGWAEHPLYPAGEFYGEFADFTVRLDVPEDQVVGSTGVPVCGDPGWERANQVAGSAVRYDRDHYGAATARLGGACAGAPAGRKRITWHAEDVHHFAMSLNPEYRYEGGAYEDVLIHVLYQPGDEPSWGGGVAVERTRIALEWLDNLYGDFAWPQITNVHRIEGGGTEFPMMMHNGSASQGLIVHELGHNYTMGILANNEWREGWLDEGFTSFQTSWFAETMSGSDPYPGLEQGLLGLELDGLAEPVSLVSEHYRTYTNYSISIYSRGELFFHQLRYIVGDETMREILRTFYDRWQLRHVNEAAFLAVAEDVSGMDLSTFFGQFLHTVPTYDYGLGTVERRREGNGWVTRVEVIRHDDGRIPVEVAVIDGADTAMVRTDGLARRAWVEVPSTFEPSRVRLDPRTRTHDWNMLNNERTLGLSIGKLLLGREEPVEVYADPFFSRRDRRDRLTLGLAPVAWYNDLGGLTVGLRSRENYLGRFERNTAYATYSTGALNPDGVADIRQFNAAVRGANPTWWRAPGFEFSYEGFYTEGRGGARLATTWLDRETINARTSWTHGAALQWVGVIEHDFVRGMNYDDGGTVELALTSGATTRSGAWALAFQSAVAGGGAYVRPDLSPEGTPYGIEPYGRFSLTGTARRALGGGLTLGARAFGGYLWSEGDGIRQRQFGAHGAGPYDQLWNPFTRSRGALFRRPDVYYHVPGNGNVRGLAPSVTAPALAALNVELEQAVLTRPRWSLFRRVGLAAFGDAVVGTGMLAEAGNDVGFTADAGVGLRMTHRIGGTEFTTRLDLPLWVERPALAFDSDAADPFAFRWVFSFQPAF